ncbi:MAG TPA: outer membrane beta-barrel protein [Casimicrobiaceae bacterium]
MNQILAMLGLAALAAAPLAGAAGLAAAPPDAAGVVASTQDTPGFYGGVELRDSGVDTAGVDFGRRASTWGRYTPPVSSDTATRRSLLFGGYRFANDLAVEGSFSTADRDRQYSLGSAVPGGGVGLSLAGATGAPAASWNADVYTAWSFLHRFSLYGRLGYAQSANAPTYALASPIDARNRDGVNYGLGLRYDVSSALGLRLEYARFPHFAGESLSGPLPESDQVQFGVQFRF